MPVYKCLAKFRHVFVLAVAAVLLCLPFGLSACDEVAADHVHEYGEWSITTPAACETPGARERVCSCGDRQTETVPATGHSYVKVDGKAATCKETGLTDGAKCAVCGDELVGQATTQKLPHVPVADGARRPSSTSPA